MSCAGANADNHHLHDVGDGGDMVWGEEPHRWRRPVEDEHVAGVHVMGKCLSDREPAEGGAERLNIEVLAEVTGPSLRRKSLKRTLRFSIVATTTLGGASSSDSSSKSAWRTGTSIIIGVTSSKAGSTGMQIGPDAMHPAV